MNGDAESEFIIQSSVAFNESLNGWHGPVGSPEVLPLVDVAHHLSDIIGAMTELSELPVDDEQLGVVRVLDSLRRVPRK